MSGMILPGPMKTEVIPGKDDTVRLVGHVKGQPIDMTLEVEEVQVQINTDTEMIQTWSQEGHPIMVGSDDVVVTIHSRRQRITMMTPAPEPEPEPFGFKAF